VTDTRREGTDTAAVARVDPGKSIEDTVVFDVPIEKATEFFMELPGDAIGRRGKTISYKLPRSFFEKAAP
jgi:hypothetical protein